MLISNSAIVATQSIISPGAIIGPGVRIGAYCLIGEHVEIGEGTVIASHTVIAGHTRIGRRNNIGHFCSIGEVNQDLKYRGEPTRVDIGDDNQIGRNATIHRGTQQGTQTTIIGHRNRLLSNVHIGHDCVIGSSTEIGNNSALAGHVLLRDFVLVGSLCAIHQFCIIGCSAQIADQSCVVQDIPPFVCASGNRAVPQGLNLLAAAYLSVDQQQQAVMRRIYERIYHCGMAIDALKIEIQRLSPANPLLRCFEDFFALSTRGIIR